MKNNKVRPVPHKNAFSCKCSECQSACENKPGWFMPNQVSALLKHYKVETIRELLGKNKFAIDWWNDDNEDILILAPNIAGNYDIQYPNNPRGQCVFYKERKCDIYKIRPFECAKLDHNGELDERHKSIADEWEKDNQLNEFKDEISVSSWGIMDEYGINTFLGY